MATLPGAGGSGIAVGVLPHPARPTLPAWARQTGSGRACGRGSRARIPCPAPPPSASRNLLKVARPSLVLVSLLRRLRHLEQQAAALHLVTVRAHHVHVHHRSRREPLADLCAYTRTRSRPREPVTGGSRRDFDARRNGRGVGRCCRDAFTGGGQRGSLQVTGRDSRPCRARPVPDATGGATGRAAGRGKVPGRPGAWDLPSARFRTSFAGQSEGSSRVKG